jgi:hypothetical protein
LTNDITERRRAERFLQAEKAVAGILTESKNTKEADLQVLQAIAERLRWEVAVFWTVDRKANVLRRTHVWHAPWAAVGLIEALGRNTVLEPDAGVAGRAWSTGEPAWERGAVVGGCPTESSASAHEGLRCGFGLPMRHGTETVGVIEFYNRELRELDKSLIASLEKIGCQLSKFCERRETEIALAASEEQFRQSQKMEVEQILVNLVVNFRDAMPIGGRLTIQTSNTVLTDSQIKRHPELPSGPYILLSVSDTGSGMDEATKTRIVEPFYTTKEVGKGAGLGLATAFGIIKQSGGFIEVDSAIGAGSTARNHSTYSSVSRDNSNAKRPLATPAKRLAGAYPFANRSVATSGASPCFIQLTNSKSRKDFKLARPTPHAPLTPEQLERTAFAGS